jgi:prepilin-type processing-associated H-X9-DG protein
MLQPNVQMPILHVADGTSNTIMMVESAGNPDEYALGKTAGNQQNVAAPGMWADHRTPFVFDGCDGARPTLAQATLPANARNYSINCTNNGEIYSFHTTGANALFGDGSVHFLHDNIKVGLMAALITRDGGEVFSLDY